MNANEFYELDTWALELSIYNSDGQTDRRLRKQRRNYLRPGDANYAAVVTGQAWIASRVCNGEHAAGVTGHTYDVPTSEYVRI